MVVTPDAQVEPAMAAPEQEPVLDENVLGESVTPESVGQSLASLESIINGTVLRTTELSPALKKLRGAFTQLLGTGKGEEVWKLLNNPNASFGAGAATAKQIWDTHKREKILIQQIDYTINLFKKLGTIYPTLIKPAFGDGQLDQEELNNLTKVITQQLKPGFFKSIIQGVTGPQEFPGLGPNNIATAITSLVGNAGGVAGQPEAGASPPGGDASLEVHGEQTLVVEQDAGSGTATPSQPAAPAPTQGSGNIASLDKFFGQLNSIFTKQPGISAPTSGAGGAPADQTATATGTAPSTGSAPPAETQSSTAAPAAGGQATAAPAPGAAPAPPGIDATKAITLKPDPATIEKLLGASDPKKDKSILVKAAVESLGAAGYDVMVQRKPKVKA
jgi:hypothetical protein